MEEYESYISTLGTSQEIIRKLIACEERRCRLLEYLSIRTGRRMEHLDIDAAIERIINLCYEVYTEGEWEDEGEEIKYEEEEG